MRLPPARQMLIALLVLLLAPLLPSCAGKERLAFAKPAASRAEPIAYPRIPAGDLTDAQNAKLIGDYDAALGQCNAKLEWLDRYFSALPEKR